MNEQLTEQMTFVPDGTPEQTQAMVLHSEIISAAKQAVDAVLDLGRKLKRMRDTAGYKRLGFTTFAEYTEKAVGMRQRQAYNYISVVEKVPAQLVEQNAAAGVTKLALLAQLSQDDQEEVAERTDLADITVADLKKLIAEKEGLAEQLSLLQEVPPVAEAQAMEIDMEQIRAEAEAQAMKKARAEIERIRQQADENRINAVDAARKAAQQCAEADLLAERNKARMAAEKHELAMAAEKKKREKQAAEYEDLLKESEKKAAKAEEEIKLQIEKARADQEAKDQAEIDKAKEDAATAEKRLHEMDMAADKDSVRVMLMFDAVQDQCDKLLTTLDEMAWSGKKDQADKLRHALAGALRALAVDAEQVEEEMQEC